VCATEGCKKKKKKKSVTPQEIYTSCGGYTEDYEKQYNGRDEKMVLAGISMLGGGDITECSVC